MKAANAIGALVGCLLVGGAGVALARRRPGEQEDRFFLYTLQPGETLSALALRFFGDGQKWPVLAEANAALLASDENVPAGASIRVPCSWETVRPGESLAAIAQRALGDAGKWRRIYEANRKALPDPNRLAVGQRLAVPKELPPVVVGDLDLLGAKEI